MVMPDDVSLLSADYWEQLELKVSKYDPDNPLGLSQAMLFIYKIYLPVICLLSVPACVFSLWVLKTKYLAPLSCTPAIRQLLRVTLVLVVVGPAYLGLAHNGWMVHTDTTYMCFLLVWLHNFALVALAWTVMWLVADRLTSMTRVHPNTLFNTRRTGIVLWMAALVSVMGLLCSALRTTKDNHAYPMCNPWWNNEYTETAFLSVWYLVSNVALVPGFTMLPPLAMLIIHRVLFRKLLRKKIDSLDQERAVIMELRASRRLKFVSSAFCVGGLYFVTLVPAMMFVMMGPGQMRVEPLPKDNSTDFSMVPSSGNDFGQNLTSSKQSDGNPNRQKSSEILVQESEAWRKQYEMEQKFEENSKKVMETHTKVVEENKAGQMKYNLDEEHKGATRIKRDSYRDPEKTKKQYSYDQWDGGSGSTDNLVLMILVNKERLSYLLHCSRTDCEALMVLVLYSFCVLLAPLLAATEVLFRREAAVRVLQLMAFLRLRREPTYREFTEVRERWDMDPQDSGLSIHEYRYHGDDQISSAQKTRPCSDVMEMKQVEHTDHKGENAKSNDKQVPSELRCASGQTLVTCSLFGSHCGATERCVGMESSAQPGIKIGVHHTPIHLPLMSERDVTSVVTSDKPVTSEDAMGTDDSKKKKKKKSTKKKQEKDIPEPLNESQIPEETADNKKENSIAEMKKEKVVANAEVRMKPDNLNKKIGIIPDPPKLPEAFDKPEVKSKPDVPSKPEIPSKLSKFRKPEAIQPLEVTVVTQTQAQKEASLAKGIGYLSPGTTLRQKLIGRKNAKKLLDDESKDTCEGREVDNVQSEGGSEKSSASVTPKASQKASNTPKSKFSPAVSTKGPTPTAPKKPRTPEIEKLPASPGTPQTPAIEGLTTRPKTPQTPAIEGLTSRPKTPQTPEAVGPPAKSSTSLGSNSKSPKPIKFTVVNFGEDDADQTNILRASMSRSPPPPVVASPIVTSHSPKKGASRTSDFLNNEGASRTSDILNNDDSESVEKESLKETVLSPTKVWTTADPPAVVEGQREEVKKLSKSKNDPNYDQLPKLKPLTTEERMSTKQSAMGRILSKHTRPDCSIGQYINLKSKTTFDDDEEALTVKSPFVGSIGNDLQNEKLIKIEEVNDEPIKESSKSPRSNVESPQRAPNANDADEVMAFAPTPFMQAAHLESKSPPLD